MWLAEGLPDSAMLQGDIQEVLAWVILAQVTFYIATVTYFIIRQSRQEAKYDALQAKTHKQIARSNRAMEAVAKLPPPEANGDS